MGVGNSGRFEIVGVGNSGRLRQWGLVIVGDLR